MEIQLLARFGLSMPVQVSSKHRLSEVLIRSERSIGYIILFMGARVCAGNPEKVNRGISRRLATKTHLLLAKNY